MIASTIDRAQVPVPYNVGRPYYFKTYDVDGACEICGNSAHIAVVELTEEQQSQWDADQSAELGDVSMRNACAQHFMTLLVGDPIVEPTTAQEVEMTDEEMREEFEDG